MGVRWPRSLYARAALFLAIGCGSLLGGVAAWSSWMVDQSVERLLDERIELARTTGLLLESRIREDMGVLAEAATSALERDHGRADAVREALIGAYRRTIFSEGAFVLGPQGELLTGVPDSPAPILARVDIDALMAKSRPGRELAASGLIEVGPLPVLVVLRGVTDREGQAMAYVGGLLQPTSTNLLEPVGALEGREQVELDLIDRRGVVVASTDPRGLYRMGDHGSVLAEAFRQGQTLQGRCHSCHANGGPPSEPDARVVLAFSPLPTLDLGLAVRQPESRALAPAFALRTRLIEVGLAFVTLFIVFAGLSVRSVVRPVTRLTEAVRRAETATGKLTLGPFGRDEIGELADALTYYHSRMVDALTVAEESKVAQERQTEATRRHLEALEAIADAAPEAPDVNAVLEQGLERLLELLDLSRGALRMRFRSRAFVASRGWPQDEAAGLLDQCDALVVQGRVDLAPSSSAPFRTAVVCLNEPGAPRLEPEGRPPLVMAALETSQGLRVTAVVGEGGAVRDARLQWLHSVLHLVAMSSAQVLLRELDQERQEVRRQFLHRVMSAQDEERRRIARDLHDTLAQDLAALRLEMERLATRLEGDAVGPKVEELERRVHLMLGTVRQILSDLRLSTLQGVGLQLQLQSLIDEVARDTDLHVALEVAGDEQPLDDLVAVTLYRIAHEALRNVVLHSRAEHAMVTVEFRGDTVELVIQDDGLGFVLDSMLPAGAQPGMGLGLVGMEERARLVGGRLSITTGPDEGTTVRAQVPVSAEAGPVVGPSLPREAP